MASQPTRNYSERAARARHPVTKRLFSIAEEKKTNLVVSADLTDTKSLLKCADDLGPYIAVFKTHIDVVSDFGEETIHGLTALAKKHNFLIFEDRKLMDIGSTVQKQYHGGALRISEWADIVNLSVLPGDGIVDALAQVIADPAFPYRGQRGFLILAEMTSKGSLATGDYTTLSIDLARRNPEAVMGFVALRSFNDEVNDEVKDKSDDEDFVVFTTGINLATAGDSLGQQYKSPSSAVEKGADFIIAGRGIYAAQDPVEAAKKYRDAGWQAYEARTGR